MWGSHLLEQGKLSNFAGCGNEGDREKGIEDAKNEKIGTDYWRPGRRE